MATSQESLEMCGLHVTWQRAHPSCSWYIEDVGPLRSGSQPNLGIRRANDMLIIPRSVMKQQRKSGNLIWRDVAANARDLMRTGSRYQYLHHANILHNEDDKRPASLRAAFFAC